MLVICKACAAPLAASGLISSGSGFSATYMSRWPSAAPSERKGTARAANSLAPVKTQHMWSCGRILKNSNRIPRSRPAPCLLIGAMTGLPPKQMRRRASRSTWRSDDCLIVQASPAAAERNTSPEVLKSAHRRQGPANDVQVAQPGFVGRARPEQRGTEYRDREPARKIMDQAREGRSKLTTGTKYGHDCPGQQRRLHPRAGTDDGDGCCGQPDEHRPEPARALPCDDQARQEQDRQSRSVCEP